MPIYEYICQNCNHLFQKLQSINAGFGDVRCPKCDSTSIERQLSAFTSASTGSGPGRSAGCAPTGGG